MAGRLPVADDDVGRRTEDEAAASRRFENRFVDFWTVVTYVLAATGLVELLTTTPEALRQPTGLALAACLAGYFLLYHLVLLRGPDTPSLRRIAVYGLAQTGIILVLVGFTPAFISLMVSLVAQLMSDLPTRLWPVPVVGLLAVAAVGFDLVPALRRGEVDHVAAITFQMLLWPALFGFVFTLLRQRWRLAGLVGDLQRAEAQLRRSALQAEELATLRERTRLAREMHDSLGHALVTVNVKLEAAERLYARDAARGAAELRGTRDLVRQAMIELRLSIDDLRGPLAPEEDLPAAIERLLAEVRERTSLVATGSVSADAEHLPREVAAACWAVAREALHNVERHAAAGSVALTLERCRDEVVLRVADDGSGVAAGALDRPAHHGVQGMRERAEALGGRLTVTPRPGGGTIVEARVPLADEEDGDGGDPGLAR